MGTPLFSAFLDDESTGRKIFDLLANDVLGQEQLEKVKLRYYDMHRNFFNYTESEAERLKKAGEEAEVWKFSEGLEPFTPKGWDHCYDDTYTVPIPITHPDFIDLTTRTEKRGAIGLDLPTWFNLKDNTKRIMLIAQDPLRGNMWYSDVDKFPKNKKDKPGRREDYICTGALVSSPFGLHGRPWRENKRGGGRMKLLVEALIGQGYGVYLTDCRKYFVYDHKESDNYSKTKTDLYRAILQREIDIITPVCIVAMGNHAYAYCKELLGEDSKLQHVPHFSGLATRWARERFGINEKPVSVEKLAEKYAEKIIGFCETSDGQKTD